MKTIKVKYDQGTEEHYLNITDFKDVVDINEVTHYEMEENGDGSLTIRFFKQILPRERSQAV